MASSLEKNRDISRSYATSPIVTPSGIAELGQSEIRSPVYRTMTFRNHPATPSSPDAAVHRPRKDKDVHDH